MRLSTDQAAVAVMLSGASERGKQSRLDGLLTESVVRHGQQCPDCSSSVVADNGLRGAELTFLCEDCGHQWSPNI